MSWELVVVAQRHARHDFQERVWLSVRAMVIM